MRLVFVSGDPGGARALAPVAEVAVLEGHDVFVLRHGTIAQDYRFEKTVWEWIEPNHFGTCIDVIAPNAVLFATSVEDKLASNMAFDASCKGIMVAHLLDFWANYRTRMETSNRNLLIPDLYFVMDELARVAALEAGIISKSLVVSGSPALANIKESNTSSTGPLVFVSEPVSKDQGTDEDAPEFRGYTETTVLLEVLNVLNSQAFEMPLLIAPHPREDLARLTNVVSQNRGAIDVRILRDDEKVAALDCARGVVGMSSVLLYQSWLAGTPCISYQPNLRRPELRYLEGRAGLNFVTNTGDLPKALQALQSDKERVEQLKQARIERDRHTSAANNVVAAVSKHLNQLENTSITPKFKEAKI